MPVAAMGSMAASVLLLLVLVTGSLADGVFPDAAAAASADSAPAHFNLPPWKPTKPCKRHWGSKDGSKWCPPLLPHPGMCPSGKVAIGYKNLLRSNDSYPSGTWGMHKDASGQDIWRLLPTSTNAFAAAPANAGGYTLPPGSGYAKYKQYTNAPDIPTIHQRADGVYMINHFEYGQPSNPYVSKLSQNKWTGELTVTDTKAVNDAAWGGSWFMCSGTISPWDSHLGSEEYPADCRFYETTLQNPATCTAANAQFTACGWTSKVPADGYGALEMARYFGQNIHPISQADGVNASSPDIVAFEKAIGFGNQAVLDQFRSAFNCYNYGWTPEINVGFGGTTSYKKWYTLGRVSHESAIVMPDLRTVYTTDDGTNCGFYMFKADKASDLSSGKLYAAKLATKAGTVDRFDVTWILLGAATQAELQALVNSRPKFSDIFDAAVPVDAATYKCPDGYRAINTPSAGYLECLKLRPNAEKLAAFLETRRYAAYLGATTEFEKEEGVTLDTKRMQLYVSYTRISKGMGADRKYSVGQPGDVNMPDNLCGAVFAYKLGSDWTATGTEALIYGTPVPADADGNTCALDGISSPDNLHYINDILLIAEDTSAHLNNVLWAYDLTTKSLTRILSSPQYAEVTGIYISYVDKYAYLALAMQHPEQNDEGIGALDLTGALAQRSYQGYIGPLSASCLKAGKKPVFDGIPVASTPQQKSAVIATTSVTYV